MVYLTTRARFCAAKRLWKPGLSEEENRSLFGPCARTHGHDYLLEVTLRGEPDPDTGLLFDVLELRDLVHREVISRVDHRELDKEEALLQGAVATVEVIARKFFEILAGKLPRGLLHEVRVWESEEAYAAYREE